MIHNPEAERKILADAAMGNLAAFEEVLLLYEREIFGYLLRLTGDRRDAEDLTQETFLKLYRNIKKRDPEKNFKSWLYTIATRTAYDWLRKRKRDALTLLPEEAAEVMPETIGDTATYDRTSAYDIRRALTALKPAYKNILLLFYQEGLRYQEIAERLAIPLNTVKTHLARAKQNLERGLDKDYG